MTHPAAQTPPRWWLALPTQPRPYHQFLRAPLWRWWRPLVALAITAALWLVLSGLITIPGMILDDGATTISPGEPMRIGPWFFLANNLSLAASIPLVMLVQWAVMGQRPGWISSIAGRLRWLWLMQCLAVAAAGMLVLLAVEVMLSPAEDLHWREYSLLLMVGSLTTRCRRRARSTCFGDAVLSVGSYFRNPVIGWVAATAVSSVVFMRLHLVVTCG